MAIRKKLSDVADLVAAQELARQVYGAMREWPHVRRGRWSTWEGGVFKLTIDTLPDGRPAAPVTVLAGDGLIVFHARAWEIQAPQPQQSLAEALGDIDRLLERWYAHQIALAAFYLGDVWKGVLAIAPEHMDDEIMRAVRWIAPLETVDRMEIQYADPARDEKLALTVNGEPVRAQ